MVTLRPRRRPTPNQTSQQGGLNVQYEGASVHLVTGAHVNITEDYALAHELLFGVTADEPKEDLDAPQEEVTVPSEKPPLVKKGKPQLIDRQETVKITVEKDEPVNEEKDED